MTGRDDAQAELLGKFQAAISGMELADIRQLAADLTLVGGKVARRAARPDLRRPPFAEPRVLRVRVDLAGAQLHRFSLGGHPFDPTSQLFLCPYDAEDTEPDDEGGIPAAEVRLDETLQEPGDTLAYLYDYGDNWELTLRLEEVLPAPGESPADVPSAVAVAGRGAAPPEDSGGGTDLASIALVVDDPSHFDLDQLNQALRAPYFVLREHGVHPRLVDLVNRLRYTPVGKDLAARAVWLVSEPTRLPEEEMLAALRAHRWFLDRAQGGGIELTSAGCLKPDDVEAASRVVPAMGDWIGKNNRESLAVPLLDFRQSLRSIGLVRKYKATLQLTRAGAAAQRDPRRGPAGRQTDPRGRRIRPRRHPPAAHLRRLVRRAGDPAQPDRRSPCRARLATP